MTDEPQEPTAPRKPPRQKAGPGRPKSYAEGKITRLLTYLRKGNSLAVACRATGVPQSSVMARNARGRADREQWIRLADENAAKSPDHMFLERYEAARAALETRLVDTVGKSAKENPADARWMLAHLNNSRWGDQSTVNVKGEKPIPRDDLFLSLGELANVVRDEIMAIEAPEHERTGALERIERRWAEVIGAWKTPQQRLAAAAPLALPSGN